MRTPIRKPGKYAGSKTDPHITSKKYQEIKDKLKRLKKISQPKAIQEVKQHASDGDFSENAAYQIAKGRLRGINNAIDKLEDQLKNAIIIDTGKSDIIAIGSQVTVEVNKRKKSYQILGSSETDPSRGIISHNSPLGKAFLGKRVGDEVRFEINGKITVYKILEIK